MLKCFKNQKGYAFIEWLFILPMIIMIVSFAVEIGFVMYDLATINYAASSMAVEAARKGDFDQDVYRKGRSYLLDWTSGEDMKVYHASSRWAWWPEDCKAGPKDIFIWATDKDTFQRGDVISVGVCYPVQFKTFLMNQLGHWIIKDDILYLKAKASALSEPFI